MADNPTVEAWAALYEAQLNRYDAIFSADHNMDTKVGVLMAATFAITAFVLDRSLFLTDGIIFMLLVTGCIMYAEVLGLTLAAMWARQYQLPANSTKDRPDYVSKDQGELFYQLIADAEYSTEKIEARLRCKAMLFNTAAVLFIVGTVLLFVVKLVKG